MKANLKKVADYEVTLLAAPSTAFQSDELLGVLGLPPRFISIDGSHEKNDVFWDLRLSENLLSAKGVVAVDDFLNPSALGVNEAVNQFLSTPRNLAPFAYIANKLFLARPGVVKTYLEIIENAAERDTSSTRSKDFVANRAKNRRQVEATFWGYNVLIIP